MPKQLATWILTLKQPFLRCIALRNNPILLIHAIVSVKRLSYIDNSVYE